MVMAATAEKQILGIKSSLGENACMIFCINVDVCSQANVWNTHYQLVLFILDVEADY